MPPFVVLSPSPDSDAQPIRPSVGVSMTASWVLPASLVTLASLPPLPPLPLVPLSLTPESWLGEVLPPVPLFMLLLPPLTVAVGDDIPPVPAGMPPVPVGIPPLPVMGTYVPPVPRPAPDVLAAWLEATRRGDAHAARRLLEAVAPAVRTVIRRALGRAHPDADDMLQESLIGFVRALDSFRGECSVLHYARRIALWRV